MKYEDFQAELRRRKRERWARILAGEKPGRAPGRRRRDPEKEALLVRLDRARLARRADAGEVVIRRTPEDGDQAPPRS